MTEYREVLSEIVKTEYREVLSEIVKKEAFELILISVSLLILLAIAWINTFVHLKKRKVKKRRQAILSLTAVTLIAVTIYALFATTSVGTINNINKDIEKETYVTYTGEYYIEYGMSPGRHLYDKYQSVYLSQSEDIEFATLYMNSFFEAIATTSGMYSGTVIYGQNSGMIVYIKGEEI